MKGDFNIQKIYLNILYYIYLHNVVQLELYNKNTKITLYKIIYKEALKPPSTAKDYDVLNSGTPEKGECKKIV